MADSVNMMTPEGTSPPWRLGWGLKGGSRGSYGAATPSAQNKINTMSISRKARKGTQRERLLDGMLLAAVRRGYAGANVAQVIAQAGVSRPTFYEYFADRDDCFLAV